MSEKICVLGLGYIGLPTASIFATNGYKVVGVDVNEAVVSTINKGNIHIEEPGLKTIVQAAINSKNLMASGRPEKADVFILAVPTPFKADKKPDLSYVEEATHSILPYLQKGNLVILESTSPPGTTAGTVASIIRKSGFDVNRDIYLAHCPERVLPGNILKELITNDRVIGGINREGAERAAKLYGSFVTGEICITDATTAEMTKLVENIYRDVNIGLANELALICEKLGINAWEAIGFANKHPRVHLHSPGPGVGGHCISVDPWFVISGFKKDARIMKTARSANDSMPHHVIGLIRRIIGKTRNPKIAVLGVAYKANVDDTRETPALEVIEGLRSSGLFSNDRIKIYDPHVKHFAYELSGFEETFRGADLTVILTDHNEFRYIDPEAVARLVKKRNILDTRNCLDRTKWEKAGFKTSLVGDGSGGR